MKRSTKTLPEITITPERKSAILQYLAIVPHWQAKLYTSKGTPFHTLTDDENELRKIEQSGTMNFNDGVLILSTSMQCFAFAKPLFFYNAVIDTGYGHIKITAHDLRKYLTRQKSYEGSLFEGAA